MPIRYSIDHDRRLVLAEGHGAVTPDDVFRYQREVWSRDDVAGYDEIVDMTAVTSIEEPSGDGMRALAAESSASDRASGKFAIVAPQELAYGLGRMYGAYRALEAKSTKQVEVFREREAALAWLEND